MNIANHNSYRKPLTYLESIPQRLARLQRELNSFLRLLLAAKRFEALALQIEDVLLAHRSAGSDVAAAQDFGDLCAQLHFVVGDEVALPHQVNAHLEPGEKILAGCWNVDT